MVCKGRLRRAGRAATAVRRSSWLDRGYEWFATLTQTPSGVASITNTFFDARHHWGTGKDVLGGSSPGTESIKGETRDYDILQARGGAHIRKEARQHAPWMSDSYDFGTLFLLACHCTALSTKVHLGAHCRPVASANGHLTVQALQFADATPPTKTSYHARTPITFLSSCDPSHRAVVHLSPGFS